MNIDSMTDAQKEVFTKAKENLKRHEWFRGVCCDDFPIDRECRLDFEGAVLTVEMQTAYWDAPEGYKLIS